MAVTYINGVLQGDELTAAERVELGLDAPPLTVPAAAVEEAQAALTNDGPAAALAVFLGALTPPT